MSWGTMLGGAVNCNIFPFPAKPEQAILSHMLADHITSTMYKLDFLNWCENREKEEGQEKRKWETNPGNDSKVQKEESEHVFSTFLEQ